MAYTNVFKKPTLTLALTASLIAGFEGYRGYVYLDPVGIPTACFGATRDASGRRYTADQLGDEVPRHECEKLLIDDVYRYQGIVFKYTKKELTPNQIMALTSFVYNVGEGAYRDSTLLCKINSGYPVGQACKEELPRWNKATTPFGNKVVLPGLTKRRAEEAEICSTP